MDKEKAASSIAWHNEKRKVKDLIPFPGNPRTANQKEAADLDASLQQFDLADPLVINIDNTVIGGNFRLSRLRISGREEVDVRVPSRTLNAVEALALNLRLNKNGGRFDYELLSNINEELLLNVGFTPTELDDIFDLDPPEKDEEHVPEEAKEAISKVGDIYQLGEHRLMCGDSTDPDHLKALLGETKLKMIFTDPPYNVNYEGHGEKTSNTIKNDHLDPAAFQGFIERAFETMGEVMAEGAVYYICSGWSSYPVFHQALIKNGLYRAGVIIWSKNSPSFGWPDFRHKHEWIIVGKKKRPPIFAVSIMYGWKKGPHFFRDTRDEYDVWEIPKTAASKYVHPTEKPVWLVEKALANSSQRFDPVGDFFCGGGSTLIACERLKRKAFLMELDPIYVDVTVRRWEEYTGMAAKRLTNGGGKG